MTNIDHMDAIGLLEIAAELIEAFDDAISQSMDGDHPQASAVKSWLAKYDEFSV